MRRMATTLRKMTPLARKLAHAGNDADRLSRSLHRTALEVMTKEVDAEALAAFMVYVEVVTLLFIPLLTTPLPIPPRPHSN